MSLTLNAPKRGKAKDMSIGFTVAGRAVGLGWIIALLVLIACFVCWLMGGVTPLMLLALIAALAVASLIG